MLFAILISYGTLALGSEILVILEARKKVAMFNNIDLASNHFKCDDRQYCSQMTSRAEAEFFIKNCPNTKMDGDRDGIPCENDSRFQASKKDP
jgi:hypothetical protein